MQETDRRIGGQLKTFAVVFAVLFAIASIVFAVAQLATSCDYSGSDFVKHGGITGLLALFGGPLAAYLLYLLLYGFAVLIESCIQMREQNTKIESALNNLKLDITLTEQDDEDNA